MIEMLVVLGIVALVTAMTLPMIIPMMRTRKLDSAVDTVKSAIILARSKAVQSRRMMNLTLLQQTDATHGAGMIVTDYDALREIASGVATGGASGVIYDSAQHWTSEFPNNSLVGKVVGMYPGLGGSSQSGIITAYTDTSITAGTWLPVPVPVLGSLYIVPSALPSTGSNTPSSYCAHWLNNYANSSPDIRFNVLKFVCLNMGEQLRYLSEGCRFDFGTGNTNDAWTYVFLPDGEVWTLPPSAQNARNLWSITTYAANGAVSGPKIWGPNNLTSATIVVYGTTGQVVSQ
jgi:type II secretory pathway pseudopilin PulG